MRLFLMRHGAAERGGAGRSDYERRLTAAGVAAVRAQAAQVGAAASRPLRVFSSPYVRARTTAELVATALGVPLEEAAALGCGATLDDIAEVLDAHEALDAALVVGHQPDLGLAVLQLTGRRIGIQPGTVVAVDLDAVRPGSGTLHAVWQPD